MHSVKWVFLCMIWVIDDLSFLKELVFWKFWDVLSLSGAPCCFGVSFSQSSDPAAPTAPLTVFTVYLFYTGAEELVYEFLYIY